MKNMKYMMLPLLLMLHSTLNAAEYVVQGATASGLSPAPTSSDTLSFTADGTFTVDTSVIAGSLIVGAGASSANVDISSSMTLTLNTLSATGGGSVNFSGSGSLTFTGTSLNFGENTSLRTITFSTGTLNLASSTQVTVANNNKILFGTTSPTNAKFALSGNADVDISIGSIYTLNMGGTSRFQANGTGNLLIGNGGITLSGTSNFVTTRSVRLNTAYSFFNIAAGAAASMNSLTATSASSIVSDGDEGSIVIKSSISLTGTSSMRLNTSNAFRTTSGSQADLVLNITGTANLLNIHADQSFAKLNMNGTGVTNLLNIYLNGNELLFASETDSFAALTSAASIVIEDFADGKVYFGSMLAVNEDESVKYITAIISGEETSLYQRADGYLYSSIPEPSQFAAILGAIALGLLVYRKRSK